MKLELTCDSMKAKRKSSILDSGGPSKVRGGPWPPQDFLLLF